MHFSSRASVASGAAFLLLLSSGCVSVPDESIAAHPPASGSGGAGLDPAPSSTPVVSEREIAAIIEDLTGRPAERRRVRSYREQAIQQGWDAEMFGAVFRDSEEVRRITPERAVDDAFRDVLHRSPSARERDLAESRLRYGDLTPGRLRAELEQTEEHQERLANRIIDRSFQVVLERRPDPDERRRYRREIIHRRRTEEDVQRALRDTEEFRVTRPNAIITAVFKDLLGREPDLEGCEPFRKKIREERWSREDFADHVRKSPEYRERVTFLVTKAYRELLDREPDPSGLDTYRKAMVERKWTEEDVRDHIRRSSEYTRRKP